MKSDTPALRFPWWLLPILLVLGAAVWLAASDSSPVKNAQYTVF